MRYGLTLNDEGNGAKKKTSTSHKTSRLLMVRYHGQDKSNDVCNSVRRNRKKLGLEIFVAKARNNGRGKERQR